MAGVGGQLIWPHAAVRGDVRVRSQWRTVLKPQSPGSEACPVVSKPIHLCGRLRQRAMDMFSKSAEGFGFFPVSRGDAASGNIGMLLPAASCKQESASIVACCCCLLLSLCAVLDVHCFALMVM